MEYNLNDRLSIDSHTTTEYADFAVSANRLGAKITQEEGYFVLRENIKAPEIVAQETIAKHMKYLLDTDYIITKINEAMIEGADEADALKERYATELQKRKEARAEINRLQNEYGLE